MPGRSSISLPSFIATIARPEITRPTCSTLQSATPAIGPTCSDHFQPGSYCALPTVRPPIFTTSNAPFSKMRVSSGVSKCFKTTSGIDGSFRSQRLQGATRQLLFQVDVSLITGDELAEDFADATMAAGEFDHAIGKWGPPEVPIKPEAHLRRALQLAAKVCAPEFLVGGRRSFQIRLSKEFCRAQRIVDTFTRHRIGKSGCVPQQRPAVPACFARRPGSWRQSGDARGITFGRLF